MGTIVDLDELVVPLGPDLVFLVPQERRVATTGGLNAQGA